MSRVSLQIAYDGPALDSGLMDVRDLAPALMAFGDLIQEAGAVVYGADHKIRVDVRAQFQKGSFGIDLELVSTFWQGLIDVLTSKNTQGVVTLLTLLGFTTAAAGKAVTPLLDLVRKLKGREPDKTIKNPDGTITIVFGEETCLTEEAVLKLYADMNVRRALEAITVPLEREGIDAFETRDASGVPMSRIAKSELPSYAAPAAIDAQEKPRVDVVMERVVGVVSLSFRDHNKWRLSDGDSTVYAEIEDREFLGEIEAGAVSFTKGDVLRCKMRLRQFQSASGIRNEWSVLKVLERYPAPRQTVMRLPTTPEK